MNLTVLVFTSIISLIGCYNIPAAVRSKWDLDIREVQTEQQPIEPQVIEVPSLDLPVRIIFNSRSSPVQVQQIHQQGARGQTERTQSQEEPHRVIHEVVRPVIQELREVILPFRQVVQEIQPVVEEVKTTVAKGSGRQNNGDPSGRHNSWNSYEMNGNSNQQMVSLMDLWSAMKAQKRRL